MMQILKLAAHQQEQVSVCNCRQLEKEASEAREEILQLRRQLEEAKDEIAKLTLNEVVLVIEAREEPEVAKLKKQLEEAKDKIIAELKLK